MRVLLTGASGWIGSHVARQLVQRGDEVHAIVRENSNLRRIEDIRSSIKLHVGNFGNGGDVPVEPDVAIHLAWIVAPGKYLTAPENRDCLEQSRQLLANLKCRAVFAGTVFEFDTNLGTLREDSPVNPDTLYAECKDALRQDVEARPNSAWIRFFYLYGPGEDKRRLVPSVIHSLRKGERAKVSPGGQARDFLHVEDVASAVIAVADSSLSGCVNIGSGEAPTVKEIVTKLGELSGKPELIDYSAVPYYKGEPMLIVADNAKLRSTGWKPKYTLASGLEATWAWWADRLD